MPIAIPTGRRFTHTARSAHYVRFDARDVPRTCHGRPALDLWLERRPALCKLVGRSSPQEEVGAP